MNALVQKCHYYYTFSNQSVLLVNVNVGDVKSTNISEDRSVKSGAVGRVMLTHQPILYIKIVLKIIINVRLNVSLLKEQLWSPLLFLLCGE